MKEVKTMGTIKTVAMAIVFICALAFLNHETCLASVSEGKEIHQEKTERQEKIKKTKRTKSIRIKKIKNRSSAHKKTKKAIKSTKKPPKKHKFKRSGKKKWRHYKNKIHKSSTSGSLRTTSNSVLVYDGEADKIVYSKNINTVVPIASITKLMTAMVLLDGDQPMDEDITVTDKDVDTLRHSSSRLAVGTVLSRREMLRLALMSSENRAAAALARNYPGGTAAFVAAMNQKAEALGTTNTNFIDPTGLHEENVSTAEDLVKMIRASSQYKTIRDFTTTTTCQINEGRRCLVYNNTNALVKRPDWAISLSKTGFINEAGRCLVMQTEIAQRPFIIVLLDAPDTAGRTEDAIHIKRWIETSIMSPVAAKRRSGQNGT